MEPTCTLHVAEARYSCLLVSLSQKFLCFGQQKLIAVLREPTELRRRKALRRGLCIGLSDFVCTYLLLATLSPYTVLSASCWYWCLQPPPAQRCVTIDLA